MTARHSMMEQNIFNRQMKQAEENEQFDKILRDLDKEVSEKYAGVGCEVQLVCPREKTQIWAQLIVRRYQEMGFFVNLSPQTKLDDADQATYEYLRLILSNAQLPK